MVDELELITFDQAGTSWVDPVPLPGAAGVLTGYTNQNINITARSSGNDFSDVQISGNDVIVQISGHIDVSGVPFIVKGIATLPVPVRSITEPAKYYIEVVAGTDNEHKSLNLITTPPVWDPQKNGYYTAIGGNRVLHWVISWGEANRTAVRLLPPYAVHETLDGYHSIVERGILQLPYLNRIKRVQLMSGAGTWTGNDKLCINHQTGQTIFYDNSADIYYVGNPDGSLFTFFPRDNAVVNGKPDAIFWSREWNCLCSYSDQRTNIWYHQGYQSTLMYKQVSVPAAYNGLDVVSMESNATVERLIFSSDNGAGQSRYYFYDVPRAATTGTQYQMLDNATVRADSLYWNWVLNVVAHERSANSQFEILSLNDFSPTDQYLLTGIKFLGTDTRLYQYNYNPVTGGAYAVYRTGEDAVFMVELSL